jgi:cysteine desulfurase
MFSNNEVGTIQRISEFARATHRKGGLFHTDAVQAVGKIPVDVKQLGVDFLSMSSHKINGPKGVGALYKREGLKLAAIIHGGGQEASLRSGTENVHGIVGFGKACEIAAQRIVEYETKVSALRNYMIDRVLQEVPNSRLNCSTQNRIANIAHFTLFGVDGEELIIKLDELGVAASTGSACSLRHRRLSHVLKAMGFSYAELAGSLRLSISILNTKEEIEQAVSILSKAVQELRKLSPFDERAY